MLLCKCKYDWNQVIAVIIDGLSCDLTSWVWLVISVPLMHAYKVPSSVSYEYTS